MSFSGQRHSFIYYSTTISLKNFLSQLSVQPFGDGSANIYINVMWRYFGQKSFPMDEREYLEHLEAIGRYITSVDKVQVRKESCV
jgi:Domain of unknown function (DUF3067)